MGGVWGLFLLFYLGKIGSPLASRAIVSAMMGICESLEKGLADSQKGRGGRFFGCSETTNLGIF